MSQIGKIYLILSVLTMIDLKFIESLTTCGCCTREDITVVHLSNAIQLLTSQMELVKYNLESMNLNIKLLDNKFTDPKDIIIGYLPDYEQQSNTYVPRLPPAVQSRNLHKETNQNSKNYNERNLRPNPSPNTVNLDNCTAFTETITELNKSLTENVKKMELLFKELPISNHENHTKTDARHYDKHFNCIEDCNSNSMANLPKSCSEATAINGFNDGVYLLNINQSDLQPFYAYCAHEKANEKGWMIIQRREDGSENFNRNWLDYKLGFGNLYGEYWIGLDRLHALTKDQSHEIVIVLKDYDGQQRFAKYSKFSVGGENDGYKLSLDCYSGDAGDSFKYHQFLKFSTYDNDNDKTFSNCAQLHKGGWWYDNCYFCNLNGVYYSMANKDTGNGINWVEWHGYNYSLKYTHMAIRPI